MKLAEVLYQLCQLQGFFFSESNKIGQKGGWCSARNIEGNNEALWVQGIVIHCRCRELLERATHLKVSTKKMKFIFKKYLEFEREHGSPAGVEAVKEKAKAYVEARTRQ